MIVEALIIGGILYGMFGSSSSSSTTTDPNKPTTIGELTFAAWVGLPQAMHRLDVYRIDNANGSGWAMQIDNAPPVMHSDLQWTISEGLFALSQRARPGQRSIELAAYRGPAEGSEPLAVVRLAWAGNADKLRSTYDDRATGKILERSAEQPTRASTNAAKWIVGLLVPKPARPPVEGASSPAPTRDDCRWIVSVDNRVAQVCGRPAKWQLVIDGEQLQRVYLTPASLATALIARTKAETAASIVIQGEGRKATLKRVGAVWRWTLQVGTSTPTGGAEQSLLDALGVLWKRWN